MPVSTQIEVAIVVKSVSYPAAFSEKRIQKREVWNRPQSIPLPIFKHGRFNPSLGLSQPDSQVANFPHDSMTTPSIPHHPRKMWHQTPAKSASQWRSHGLKAKIHNLLPSNSFASNLWFSDSFDSTCILYTNIVYFFKAKHKQVQLRLRHGYCLTPSGTGIAMFRKQKTNCCLENEMNFSWLPKRGSVESAINSLIFFAWRQPLAEERTIEQKAVIVQVVGILWLYDTGTSSSTKDINTRRVVSW